MSSTSRINGLVSHIFIVHTINQLYIYALNYIYYIYVQCILFRLYGGVLAFLLVCFGLSGVLYKAGDRLLYHPEQPPHSRVFIPTPALFNMPFENLFIKAR